MIKKIVGILTVTILFGCSEKKRELTQILAKDSIQYWNYEWKRNFPDEFGKTFCFNKNGELLEYLYIKKSEHRVIYKKAFRNPNKWSLSKDSLLKMHNTLYKVIYFNEDTVKLVNSKFKDTSLLLRTTTEFDILVKNDPDNFIIRPITKDTIWLFTH